jgi:hypothetical protein
MASLLPSNLGKRKRANVAKNPDKEPATSAQVDQRCHIKALPNELLLMICESAGAATSTCLGLTCRKLYEAHRRIYGSVCLSTPLEESNRKLLGLIGEWIRWMYRGQSYDEDDHIFRDVSYLQTLNDTIRSINWNGRMDPDPYYDWQQLDYDWQQLVPGWQLLEDPSFGLYVSKCVCKGANGPVTRWQRESEGQLERRERVLGHIRRLRLDLGY